MRNFWLAILAAMTVAACGQSPGESSGDVVDFDHYEAITGFLDLYWDADGGRLLFRVEDFDTPFLYQSSLPRGVGSNDLGLDRGQLGVAKLMSFERSGPKILLVEHNTRYRALSDDPLERQAVTESFARSVIWGFEMLGADGDAVVFDATDFLLRDAHGIADRLSATGEGQFQADPQRSAIYLPRTRAFPDNTEIEAIVTLTGKASGEHLPTVVPDGASLTTHMHHSFIRLPDDDYEPLPYDPRAGVIGLSYGGAGFADYASPIGEPLIVNFGRRHRLEKVDPAAEVSEAVEPIVYYLDPGAPEPVRSALLEGARWWNQAFEAAGYKNAFQVKMLPADADPMDVRYNTIQWVHRSTRGWSYGDSVVDPRTGEILKGHVSLGSLRVRQDYLIVEGLLSPYAGDTIDATMLEVALSRIRQLSAHEVGHTIGFEHNFAASTQDRSSVMDYPFPRVSLSADGELDFSEAYDEGIGSWDKRTVLYAYQDFPGDVDADAARDRLMEETLKLGYKYVADADSRAIGSAHPDGNLWDDGADAIAELEHLMRLREHALGRLSQNSIRSGRPMATLEEVLVPVYLLHRFQIQAVGKLIGGSHYQYALRGDGQQTLQAVSPARQRAAIDALFETLAPQFLRLPESLLQEISPRPPGHPANRETFARHTGVVFDKLAPARSAVDLTLDVLLEPDRAARLERGEGPGFSVITERLLEAGWTGDSDDPAMQAVIGDIALLKLMQLVTTNDADPAVRAEALAAIHTLDEWLAERLSNDATAEPRYALARLQIERMRKDPASVDAIVPVEPPPGSPIGARME